MDNTTRSSTPNTDTSSVSNIEDEADRDGDLNEEPPLEPPPLEEVEWQPPIIEVVPLNIHGVEGVVVGERDEVRITTNVMGAFLFLCTVYVIVCYKIL